MNAAEARALLFQNKLNFKNFERSFPNIPQLDGQLGLLEVPSDELEQIEKMTGPDGKPVPQALQLATTIVKSLVMRDSKQAVFGETDAQGVAGFGLSVLKPIGEEIKKLSNPSVEEAKKNSTETPASDSATSSAAS